MHTNTTGTLITKRIIIIPQEPLTYEYNNPKPAGKKTPNYTSSVRARVFGFKELGFSGLES